MQKKIAWKLPLLRAAKLMQTGILHTNAVDSQSVCQMQHGNYINISTLSPLDFILQFKLGLRKKCSLVKKAGSIHSNYGVELSNILDVQSVHCLFFMN